MFLCKLRENAALEATRQSAWVVRCHLPLGELPRSKGRAKGVARAALAAAQARLPACELESLALPGSAALKSIGNLSCQRKRRGRFVISKSAAAARAARQGKSGFWRSVMLTRIPSNDESCLEMVRDCEPKEERSVRMKAMPEEKKKGRRFGELSSFRGCQHSS